MSALEDALARPALTVDGRDYTVADVAAAALHVSEWAGVRQRALAGGAGAPEEEVRAAAAAFRRARRLLSAEEMEAWLARRGLSAGVWMRWVRADVARRAGATGGAAEPDAVTLYAEALCSGALARAGRRLAELLVAPEADAASAPAADPGPLAPLGVDLDRARTLLGELPAREAALARLAEQVATPQAVDERVRARQTDWLAVGYRALAVAAEPVAREALLCVRDDGMTLEEVGVLASAPVRARRTLLADAPPALREHLLSASPGEPIGPLAGDGAVAVLVVDAKEPPAAEDAELARRARNELLARALEREVTTRVRWHDRL